MSEASSRRHICCPCQATGPRGVAHCGQPDRSEELVCPKPAAGGTFVVCAGQPAPVGLLIAGNPAGQGSLDVRNQQPEAPLLSVPGNRPLRCCLLRRACLADGLEFPEGGQEEW